ncbi:MAG: alginate export family protein [Methylococcaceae bacterium]|nr:alginate export family protein [Methylococcaceae bacterium]
MKPIHRLRRIVRLICIPCVLASLALTTGSAASAEYVAKDPKKPEPWKAETNGPYGTKWRLELNNRLRGEFVDWFGDQTVNGGPRDSTYNFMGNKFQLGVRVKGEPFEAFAQFQDTVIAGLPSNGVGVGSVYFANTPRTTQNGAFLRQGWLKLKYDGFYVSGGRQLYSDQAQGAATNKSLKWIQDFRLAQRLIGPFEYTHVGRSFDGGTLGYLSDDFEVGGFAFIPTFGGFEINGNKNIPDINIAGVTLNLRDSKTIGNTIGQLSYYYYGDTRNLVVTDNRPAAVRARTKGQSLDIHTLGVSAAHVLPIGSGLADGMFYGYGQFGNWQNQNNGAWAYGVEFGYQLPDVWGSPWLRAGVNSASGDSNPNDGNHNTFFQLLPTAWLYAQFPFYNMMNNQDVFVQAIVKPHPKVNVRLDFHWLRVNESNDLLYSGAGATSDSFFGYAGAPTGGSVNLAYLTHFMVNFKPLDYLSFNMFYAHAFGQSIINKQQYSGSQGNYGFLEAIVSF